MNEGGSESEKQGLVTLCGSAGRKVRGADVLDGAVTISRSDSTDVCNAFHIQLQH